MSSINKDIKKSAKWIAKALSSSGYTADFSPSSLREIDRFFDEQTIDGQAKLGGLLSEQLGSRLFAVGGYVGEVIRRNVGGEWHGDDNDPKAEINIEFKVKDGPVCFPVKKVMKRFQNGSEEGIAVYGSYLGLSLDQKIIKSKGLLKRIFDK